jgi:hypothetical protein
MAFDGHTFSTYAGPNVLADFISDPVSERPRSTGEPLLGFKRNLAEHGSHDFKKESSRRTSYGALYIAQQNCVEFRVAQRHTSCIRSDDEHGGICSNGSSFRDSEDDSSLSNDRQASLPSSKRRSLRRISLHRLSSRDSQEDSVQDEDSDFFQNDDYARFASKRTSQSKRHAYFARLSAK